MYPVVATKRTELVEAMVQSAYLGMFSKGDQHFIPKIFNWVTDCFEGRYGDYQAIDARYHDFEHTLQVTLCMARLLAQRQTIGASPVLSQRMVELGLLAILLHDTGYLKTRDDTEGTGAKYTTTHVNRSADFAAGLLGEKGFLMPEILSVQNMIRCTGVDATLSLISFQSEQERITGFALATADLLGQMAAEDYIEKLPCLYAEFAEAAAYSHTKGNYVSMFSSAADLLAKTPAFWEHYVKVKLERDFGGLHTCFNHPYPDGPNWYLDKIEANINKLREQLADGAGAAKQKS